MTAVQSDGKCHVLMIYRTMIPSVRLCGHSQMQALAEMGLVEYRAVQEMRLSVADMNWADTVLLGRLDNWYEHRLACMLFTSGKRIVYILDDDLLNIPSGISSASYYGQEEIQGYIRDMIRMSHAILSPSPVLLEKYATDGREGMKTEEPALEAVPYRPHGPDRPIKIGFAGSIDRTEDIETILKEALLRVKERYGDRVCFEFFGAVPEFAKALDASVIPYTESYEDYRRRLNALEWDIGLAPMPDTPFHACKHYNKFCEYAAAGIAGIYSDNLPYAFIPNREAFGRFCKNDPDDWFAQICAEIDDARTRETHRRRCSEYALSALSPATVGRELYEAYPSIFAVSGREKAEVRNLDLLKLHNVLNQAGDKLRRYGLKTPVVAMKKLLTALRNPR